MLLGVDVGGTFTDAVLVMEERSITERSVAAPQGRDAGDATAAIYTAKVPSTPGEQSRGVMEAVRAVLASASAGAGAGAGAQPGEVERFAHGMTVATNALLEGHGARTALIATEGFTDIVALGRQTRAHLYRLCAPGPAPLAPPELRFGAPERMTPDGPLRALDPEVAGVLVEEIAGTGRAEEQAQQQTEEAGQTQESGRTELVGVESVAVALLHSYAHPEHERLLGKLIAERLPAAHVSLSHELVGTFREYERAATTEVDAALSPLLSAYLRRLGAEADAIGLAQPAVMQSSGGLTSAAAAAAHAAVTVLSGPAGGVRGALALAEAAGERDVLCFDMGGTSCDVCLIEGGRVAETAEGVVAGRPLALAMLDIHTVGAGGGSIAWQDPGGALRVGPRSAGADPGPACYGRGGDRPTVTDANLLLGRLPANVSLAGGLELDREAAERAVAALGAQLGLSTRRCAEGIVRVAEAEMLGALRAMTVERGIDPRDFALMPFGGAGPLHAAALARELGMRRILCPRASGVLCALGLAAAAPRRDAARTVMLAGATLNAARLAEERAALLARTRADLGEEAERVAVRYELRYRGQSFELSVEEEDEVDEDEDKVDEEEDKVVEEEDKVVEEEDKVDEEEDKVDEEEDRVDEESAEVGRPPSSRTRVRATRPSPRDSVRALQPDALREAFAQAHEQRYGYRDDGAEVELVTIRVSAWGAAPKLRLAGAAGEPAPGTRIEGPTICALPESTLYVPSGWAGEVDAQGTVRLHDVEAAA